MPLKRLRPACLSALASFAVALPMACLPVSGVAQTSAMAPVASRLTQRIDESQQIPLKGTVHRLANAANDRGAVDSSLTLGRVEVVLKRSPAQETALRQLIQDMHTPGTASYHKWLTPAQFGEQFGPSDADIATLTSWLSSKGFTVTKVNPGKQTLEFTGNAGQFSNTFHTQIHKYEVEGQIHTANASEPTIPAALAPVFGGFASLNNFHPQEPGEAPWHGSVRPGDARSEAELDCRRQWIAGPNPRPCRLCGSVQRESSLYGGDKWRGADDRHHQRLEHQHCVSEPVPDPFQSSCKPSDGHH